MTLSTPIVYNITYWPNAAAVVILIVNSIFGLLFNLAIIQNFVTDKKQKTSFNLICVFRALNNVLILLIVMIGVFLPATILGYSIYPPIVETVLITGSLNLMIFNEFQGIYLSVNRLFAIFFPFKYEFFFGIKATLAFHLLYYAERIYHVTQENIERYDSKKYLLYSVELLTYGGLMSIPNIMFLWALGLLVLPFFVNGFTYVRFYYLKKQASQSSENRNHMRRNMRMFFQTLLQDSLFSISTIASIKFNMLLSHRFYTFFIMIFMWQIVQVLDGLIMIFFNERLTVFNRKNSLKIRPTAVSGRHTSVHPPQLRMK